MLNDIITWLFVISVGIGSFYVLQNIFRAKKKLLRWEMCMLKLMI